MLVRYFPIAGAFTVVALTALAVVLAQHLGGGKPVVAWTTVPDACAMTSPAISPYATIIQSAVPGSATDPSILMATTTGSLITDCNSLLAARDTLQPSASSTAVFKDWSASTNMHIWSGVIICPRADGSVGGENCRGIAAGSAPRVVSLGCQGCNLQNGSLHAALGNLHKLRSLNLGRAGLTGTIPPELGNLKELTLLSLRGYSLNVRPENRIYTNTFSGQIPPELGQMTSLEDLWLEGNQLTGSIPEELGNLSNLETLLIDENFLTGSIPEELGNLSSLRDFRATYNSFYDDDGNKTHTGLTGSIPGELGNLSSLQVLRLEGNSLSGSIPPELGNLSNLRELRLTRNELTGSIPPELGRMSSLVRLQLGRNMLSGEIPAELGRLSNLFTLYLHVQKREAVDDESGETVVTHPGLTGALPRELGSLSRLGYMALFSNSLEGVIPPEWRGMSGMESLWVWDNPDLITRVDLTPDRTTLGEADGETTVNVTARVDAGSEWLAQAWARPVSAGAANYTSAFTGQDVVIEAAGSGGANVVGFAATPSAAFTIPSAIATIEPPLTTEKRSALPDGMGSAAASITITPEDDDAVEGDETISLSVSGKGIAIHYLGEVKRATKLVTGRAGAIRLLDKERPPDTPTPTPTATATTVIEPPIIISQPTRTPTVTRTPVREMGAAATSTPTPTATLTATATQTATPTATATATITLTPTATLTATATITLTPTPTATAVATPTPESGDTRRRQPTRTPRATATAAAVTATAVATGTGTPVATATATPVATITPVVTPTGTAVATATAVAIALATGTPDADDSPATATLTPTATGTAAADVREGVVSATVVVQEATSVGAATSTAIATVVAQGIGPGVTATVSAVAAQGVAMGPTATVVAAPPAGNGVGGMNGEADARVAAVATAAADDDEATPALITSVANGAGSWWWLLLALAAAYVAWRAWRRWRRGRLGTGR